VKARDRAILSATLAVASVSEALTVEAMAAPIAMARAEGVIGGMLGGTVNGLQQTVAKNAIGESMDAISQPVQGRSFSADLKTAPQEATPHIRSYFPEALYINPEIITDAKGNASISIPVADSITIWRMAILASTQSGALGSGTSSLKVFQDFFVDLDLPVALTQGDQVSIPVAVYNYSGKIGQVSLKLQPKTGSLSITARRRNPSPSSRAALAVRSSLLLRGASANSS
jgi:hypothetical protein